MAREKVELDTLVSFDFKEFKVRFGKTHVAGGYRIGRQSLEASAHDTACSWKVRFFPSVWGCAQLVSRLEKNYS